MSQLQGLHLHVQAHVLTAPREPEPLECHRPLSHCRPSLRVCNTPSLNLLVVCMCISLPPSCPELGTPSPSSGPDVSVGLGTLVWLHRGRGG